MNDDIVLGFLKGKGFVTDSLDEAIQLWIGQQPLAELREYGIFKDGKLDTKAARKAIEDCMDECKVPEDDSED